ncbi:MAG: adenylate/guanylate cyclase domain-containing protein [Alphaproteobacteria bacterium]|nr:adenylate/guanylate cyclase domain-containing protein [Alphaproteobacteria bacterium]
MLKLWKWVRSKAYLIVPLIVLLAGLGLRAFDPGPIKQLRNLVFDSYQRIQPRPYLNPQQGPYGVGVRIVDIDDDSLEKMGQWPWSRNQVADMIAQLTNLGAATIVFDFVFPEPDRTSPRMILPTWAQAVEQFPELKTLATKAEQLPDPDEQLGGIIAHPDVNVVTGFALTMGNTPRVPVLRASFAQGGDDPRYFVHKYVGAVANLTVIEKGAKGNGSFNMVQDPDGLVRRVPLVVGLKREQPKSKELSDQFELYPTLAAEALRVVQGAKTFIIKASGASGEQAFGEKTGITSVKIGRLEVPTNREGEVLIHYTENVPERYVPAWQVFEKGFDASKIEGHVVFIGTSAAGLKDLRSTVLDPALPGVEVHVQLLEQVLTNHYLTKPDWADGLEIVSMLIMGSLLIFILGVVGALPAAVVGGVFVAAAVGASWYGYVGPRLLVDPVFPILVATLIYISSTVIRYMDTEREKERVRGAFGMYLSPTMVEQLAGDPEKLQLGGEMREMSIMFMDVRGFTTISEQFDAVGLTRFMNKFLTPMSDIIMERKGTIDKYIGDCIMAFWNAPIDDSEHAQNACRSALEMIRRREVLNVQFKAEAEQEKRKHVPLNIGIGVNTGLVCVGNMGSERKFNYSVLGDDVNLASRLEGQSKPYHVDFVIGENTEALLQGKFASLELDLIKVKGKTKPVRIFTVLGEEDVQASEEFQKLKVAHDALIQSYRAQAWDKCDKLIPICEQLSLVPTLKSGHGFYGVMKERVEEFRQAPPGADWDGVYVATSK